MTAGNTITFCRTARLDEVPGLIECLDSIKKRVGIEHYSRDDKLAAGGDTAGNTLMLRVFPPVQDAGATPGTDRLSDMGSALWNIVRLAEKTDTRIIIGKSVARMLLIARAKSDAVEEGSFDEVFFEKARVYGPMEVDAVRSALYEKKSPLTDVRPYAYFMAVVIPILHNRSRTYWYVMRSDGMLLSSWTTQTFTSRLPDFLKPAS